jgi:hypothetical protein
MVDRGSAQRTENPVGHVGRPGNLKKMTSTLKAHIAPPHSSTPEKALKPTRCTPHSLKNCTVPQLLDEHFPWDDFNIFWGLTRLFLQADDTAFSNGPVKQEGLQRLEIAFMDEG